MGVPYGSIKMPVRATTAAAIIWVLRLVLQLSKSRVLACLSHSETSRLDGIDQSVSAAETVKSRLPLIRYTGCKVAFQGLEEEDEDRGNDMACSICLCCMRRGQLMRKLSCCHHVFHAGCLDRWIAECLQVNCPNCRALL